MAPVTEEQVLTALARVAHPLRSGSIVELSLVKGVVIKGSNVGVTLEVDPQEAARLETMRKICEEEVKALPGVTSCTTVLTAERAPGGQPSGPPPSLSASGAPQQRQGAKAVLPRVAAIVAVASGKGGVGKSTTAINLATGLSAIGLRTGLLDADIYGPSVPRMAGVTGKPTSIDGKALRPMQAFGVKLMSMGFLVDEDAPMIWRGPMVQSALQQMLGDVDWGDLDVLVVDLPPGTGDAQLTMAQRVPLTGAVIVSTPQDIALLDARKAINMFRRVDVPILGIVENMSYHICPSCGHRSEIFAHGGARACASQFGVDFLSEIPLDPVIRETSDGGQPIVVSRPEGPHAEAYRQLAMSVRDKIATLAGDQARSFPRIRYL